MVIKILTDHFPMPPLFFDFFFFFADEELELFSLSWLPGREIKSKNSEK
jgi:hypothetical protein